MASLSVDAAVAQSGGVQVVQSSSAVSTVLEHFDFSHPRRGICLLINNHHFNRGLTQQLDRDGTEVDAENVQKTFQELGFEVLRYDDLTVTDMSINVREVAERDHSDADCFACVILSHGDEGVIYGTNGIIKIDRLTYYFKGDVCASLRGKPKLFFIQACRGRHYDFGAEVESDATDSVESVSVRKIPVEADFLMAYSVVPGYFSWRNNVDGSWFIQALCRVFREHGGTLELMSLMTLVNKIVAYEFASCTDTEFTNNMKQVPCMASTLTKLTYFKPAKVGRLIQPPKGYAKSW